MARPRALPRRPEAATSDTDSAWIHSVDSAVKGSLSDSRHLLREKTGSRFLRGRRNVILPGQYYDAEAGLTYNGARYYDQQVGRYVESDPIGLHGGLNLYAYVSNSPTDGVDPLGTLRQGSGFSGPSDPR